MKKIILFAGGMLICGFVLAQTTGSQTKSMLQRSPAGEKLIRFVQAVNGDLEVNEDFVNTNFSKKGVENLGEPSKAFNELAEKNGKLVVYEVYRKSYFTFDFTIKGAKSGWVMLSFDMHNQMPYGINSYEVKSIDTPEKIGEDMGI